MNKIWQTKSSKTVLKTRWFKIKHDRYILPDKKEGDYFFVASRGSSIIVPITKDRKFVMVRQYRYLTKKISTEFPMGGMEEGQTALHAARAELKQETGYRAMRIIKIGAYNPFIGATDEICNVFLAEELVKTNQEEDDSEKIEVVIYSSREIDQMIDNKQISDCQSIAAWYLVQKFLKTK